MDSIDPDKLEGLFEATEDWSAAMAMSNSMAYVSQFGEYNPGGGEDNVLKYLLEAKTQVVLAQKALQTIVEALGLEV
jgi:Ca2+ transporting ATPase